MVLNDVKAVLHCEEGGDIVMSCSATTDALKNGEQLVVDLPVCPREAAITGISIIYKGSIIAKRMFLLGKMHVDTCIKLNVTFNIYIVDGLFDHYVKNGEGELNE